MAGADDSNPRRRVVIALDPIAPEAAALDLAILQDMLREGIEELVGMFMEDTRLLAHARSRLATEVVLTGAARPLDARSLERQLRAKAAEARRRFESTALQLGLPHAFRVTRGEPLTELSSVAAAARALVIAVAGEAAGARTWAGAALHELARLDVPALLFAREGWQRGRSVVAVIEDPAQVAGTLANARRLARAAGVPLKVYLGGAALTRRQELSDVLTSQADETAAVSVQSLPAQADPSAAVRALLADQPRMVVLAAPAGDVNVDLLKELLRRTSAAVLVLR